MKPDLSKSVIRTPDVEERGPLYAFLGAQFPGDAPLFDALLQSGRAMYTATHYGLYVADRLLGSASLLPLRIWLGRRPVTVLGVASVATAAAYRRQGIAQRLLAHLLRSADAQGLPGVLFTGVPAVYQGMGFQSVPQRYLAVPAAQPTLPQTDCQTEVWTALCAERCRRMAEIYADSYPHYDGKIDRDDDYWWLYAALFRYSARARLAVCLRHGTFAGYVRFDEEPDRLTVCELCTAPAATDATSALLRHVQQTATRSRRPWLTLALPEEHFAWPLLKQAGAEFAPEPAGAARETFMVRPAPGGGDARLLGLQWSLADKF